MTTVNMDVNASLELSTSSAQTTLGSSRMGEIRRNQAERDQLITAHMDLVRYAVRAIQATLPAHIDQDELEAAGYLGLIDAAEKFDGSKHVQFRSYAQFRIRGSILDSLRTTDWSPRALRRQGREVEKAIQTASQRVHGTATDTEIAEELGISLSEYHERLTQLSSLEIGSLQASRGDESEDGEVTYVAGPVSEEPLFRCLEGELKQHLMDAIEALPERERLVLTLSYFEEMTLKEIASAIGVVESRASQLRSSAVTRLRSALAAVAPHHTKQSKTRLSTAA